MSIATATADTALEKLRQHLIDPEMCARCGNCEVSCPHGAILNVEGTFVVDAATCCSTLECVRSCSTGAIDHWRLRAPTALYTTDEQSRWTQLPPLAPGEVGDAAAEPDHLHARAPADATRPMGLRYTHLAPASATVLENRQLTSGPGGREVRHLVLQIDSPGFVPLEGQSVGVLAPGVDEHGVAHHARLYSIASAREGEQPGTRTFAFTVGRVLADHDGQPVRGVCSNYLCDLAAGASIRITGPMGDSFLMPESARIPLLMICTGTGIAPMRGMLQRRLRRDGAQGAPMLLLYGARSRDELPYADELDACAAPALELRTALSRVPGTPKRYVQQLVDESAARVARLVLEDGACIYVCGLSAMEHEIDAALGRAITAAGRDWNSVRHELKEQGRYHVEVY